jgi:hypothetical protein
MNVYVIAYLSFFENINRLFKVEAPNEIEAIKIVLIQSCSIQEHKESQIEWNNENDFDTVEDLIDCLYEMEIAVAILKL